MGDDFRDRLKRWVSEKQQRELEAEREKKRKEREVKLACQKKEAEKCVRKKWMEQNLLPYVVDINKYFLAGKGRIKTSWKGTEVSWNHYERKAYLDTCVESGKRIILSRNWEGNHLLVVVGRNFFGTVDLSSKDWRIELDDILMQAIESDNFKY